MARLHTDSLCAKSTLRSLRQTLDKLPDSFKDTYDNALARIDRQSEEQRKLAYRVFSWMSYAFRPLSLVELQYAVAIEDMTEMDEEDLNDERFLLSVCGGFVTIFSILTGTACFNFFLLTSFIAMLLPKYRTSFSFSWTSDIFFLSLT